MGLTDELVGRVLPLLRVAYEAGRKDGMPPNPAPGLALVPGEAGAQVSVVSKGKK